jgi:adenosylcobinamide-GDP ribazoletransferase
MATSMLSEEPKRRGVPGRLVDFGSGTVMSLLAALQFLTIVPPLVRRPFTEVELGRAVGFFPLVGILIGAVLAGLDVVLTSVFPAGVSTALVLASWVLLTGALHLDGFLDTCDGLWGGSRPEERLRILRDERVGSFAVVGGVLLLLLKYAALETVVKGDLRATEALVLAATLARWCLAVAIVAFPSARAEGLGRAVKDQAGWGEAALATLTAGVVAWLLGEWRGLATMLVASLVTLLAALYAVRRLRGLTGDVYGAICELAEVIVLLVLIAGVRLWA